MTDVLLAICSLVLPRTGHAEPEALPKVIMVEIPGVTANDDVIYEAIRAQLSAVSVRLERLMVEDAQSMTDDPLGGASGLAADSDADMVFWITEMETVYTIFVYTRHDATGQIQTREMELASENQLSRSDTVGNAVSSFVEEAFHVPGNRAPPAAATPPAEKKPTPPPLHSMVPFMNAIWSLTDILSIVAGLGASLAVNEKAYRILLTDGSEVSVIEPFFAKLTYQAGVIVQL